jgi:hypothetical protein
MKQKTFLKNVLAFFLYIVLNLSTQAQTPNHKYFIISGKIIAETEFVEPGEIRIIKKDSPAVYMSTPSLGRFRLELDYNTDYQLTFTQIGRMPKTVFVNTEVPLEVYHRKTNLPHFLMAVKLFADIQDVSNTNYSENQKQQITYSSEKGCFLRVPTIFDVEYVDKANLQQASAIESQENKSKLKTYQVF